MADLPTKTLASWGNLSSFLLEDESETESNDTAEAVSWTGGVRGGEEEGRVSKRVPHERVGTLWGILKDR